MVEDTDTAEVPSPKGLSGEDWLRAVDALTKPSGGLEEIDGQHFAVFVERTPRLLVAFETVEGAEAVSDTGAPLSLELGEENDWSTLTILANGDTWFRSEAMYAHFDELIDDGFFDGFEQVLFYGAGAGGYAAAAYSVAAPGARVVAVQPQATLDPRLANWDDRFLHMRRTDFTSRYGYAPDMLDAAEKAFILFDPMETLDSMHAALFTRTNVEKLRTRWFGEDVQQRLLNMQILTELLTAAMDHRLDENTFAALMRTRRSDRAYRINVVRGLVEAGHLRLAAYMARLYGEGEGIRHFKRLLRRLRTRAKNGDFVWPFDDDEGKPAES